MFCSCRHAHIKSRHFRTSQFYEFHRLSHSRLILYRDGSCTHCIVSSDCSNCANLHVEFMLINDQGQIWIWISRYWNLHNKKLNFVFIFSEISLFIGRLNSSWLSVSRNKQRLKVIKVNRTVLRIPSISSVFISLILYLFAELIPQNICHHSQRQQTLLFDQNPPTRLTISTHQFVLHFLFDLLQ